MLCEENAYAPGASPKKSGELTLACWNGVQIFSWLARRKYEGFMTETEVKAVSQISTRACRRGKTGGAPGKLACAYGVGMMARAMVRRIVR